MTRYLYWAYYGYLPPETWRVIVGNAGHGQDSELKNHHVISYTGEMMSGVYHAIELVILLNLMVSIMTAAAVSVVVSFTFNSIMLTNFRDTSSFRTRNWSIGNLCAPKFGWSTFTILALCRRRSICYSCLFTAPFISFASVFFVVEMRCLFG